MPDLMQRTLFDLFDALAFPRSAVVTDADETSASNSGKGTQGAVFTRIEVVDFALDLVSHVTSDPSHTWRFPKPSLGAFVGNKCSYTQGHALSGYLPTQISRRLPK